MEKTVIDFLEQIIKIKSYNLREKEKCAILILNKLRSIGFIGELIYGFGAPIIFVNYNCCSNKNILFYSHYDIKHEGNINDWKVNPFKLNYDKNSNKIFARGSGDAKGQIAALIYGIENAIKRNKKLSYNITLVIEGDEETGSLGLKNFCMNYLQDIIYKSIIVIDSHWLGEYPVIYTGSRGQQSINVYYNICDMEENLHAGNYGGIYIGAARKMINVLTLLLNEIELLFEKRNVSKLKHKNAVSLTHISSGDSKRSTIPKNAFAKLDIRFIDNSIPQQIICILEKFKKQYDLNYKIIQQEESFYNKGDASFINEISSIIKHTTKLSPYIESYSGAYIPMKKLESIKGEKYVIPFAQADEHNHSPNENISLTNIEYGEKIIEKLLQYK